MIEKLASKVVAGTKWSMFAEIASKLLAPIVNVILARILSPEAFGLVATITIVTTLEEVVSDAGFQKYIIQREFAEEKEYDISCSIAFWCNLIIAIAFFLIIVVFRTNIVELLGSPGLENGLVVSCVATVLCSIASINTARLKREFDFKSLFIARIISALMPLVITVPLALLLRNYWALVIGLVGKQFVNWIIVQWRSKWIPQFKMEFKILKGMLPFCLWTLGESITIWFCANCDVFIIGRAYDQYTLGLYKSALSTIVGIMSIIGSAMTPVFYAALSRHQNNIHQFNDTFYTFQKITAWITVPMGIGMYIFRDLVTFVLLGEQYEAVADFLGIYALIRALLIPYGTFCGEAFRSQGHPQVALFVQLQNLLVLLPATFWATNYELTWMGTIVNIARLEIIPIGYLLLKKEFDIKFIRIIKGFIPTFFASLIMCLLGQVLLLISREYIISFVWILLCIICYFGILITFKDVRRRVKAYITEKTMKS